MENIIINYLCCLQIRYWLCFYVLMFHSYIICRAVVYFLLLQYSKLSVSGYYFPLPVMVASHFRFCEVDSGHFCCSLSLKCCKIEGSSQFSATGNCQLACGLLAYRRHSSVPILVVRWFPLSLLTAYFFQRYVGGGYTRVLAEVLDRVLDSDIRTALIIWHVVTWLGVL